MVDDPLAVPEALQKHWAFHGARLSEKKSYRGQSVYLAEGGPHDDAKGRRVVDEEPGPGEIHKDDLWMKEGYYVSAWAIIKGKMVIGFPLYFDKSQVSAKARLNSAFYAAKDAIDAMISAGHLEKPERIWTP